MTEIRNLEELLTNSLPETLRVGKCITKALTKPGDNYGGILLSVEVEVQNVITEMRTVMYLVAKLCPTHEVVLKIFQIPNTFKREIAMYNTIFPTLVEFQREQGISNVSFSLPKYYGSRISLNADSNVVDDDAVILLENLNPLGFVVVDRLVGFDLDTTKLILKELAKFHSVPIALRMMRPGVFNYKVLPHVQALSNLNAPVLHHREFQIENIIEAAKLNPQCCALIPKVLRAFKISFDAEETSFAPREPFVTIAHNDFWVNNIMVKFIETKPVEIKLIDFQFIQLGSPCTDIVFFIYTSVQFNVIKDYFDELISCYYDTFISVLKSLKCDVESFNYASFLQELEASAKEQFWHVLHRLPPTLMPKGDVFNFDELLHKDPKPMTFLPEHYCKRVSDIILHFNEKNWL